MKSNPKLRILVYRAGPLAYFGHNHVIVNHAVRGPRSIWRDVPGDSVILAGPCRFAGFVVDDAPKRAAKREPISRRDVPDSAKSGTLHNMLSARRCSTPMSFSGDRRPQWPPVRELEAARAPAR